MKRSSATQSGDQVKETAVSDRSRERKKFIREVAFFLILFIVIYLYFMLADLSSAPKFIYAQF